MSYLDFKYGEPMEPTIGSIRGFQPSTAAQANPMSIYESAASNWSRLRDHLGRAEEAAKEANEEHQKASAAEHEAWLKLQDVAGRGAPPQACDTAAASFIPPYMPRTSR